MEHIGFNKPYLTGLETKYIEDAVAKGKISGNGMYTKKCQDFFETRYDFKKTLLTTSCTDALEMCAILLNIQEGDEVIMPSYTFVSTANAFVLRGAKIVFADSKRNHPNMDETKIEALITNKTKAIVVVHYAGIACDMDIVMELSKKYNIPIVEDAAQAIDSYYKNRPLGSIGHLGTFSFHETKNIQCGEGGLLAINDEQFIERAEIIWEKGTNRAAFFRGEIDKYGWIDVGSSFLPSEITAAFLWAQLENLEKIQQRRKQIWEFYNEKFSFLKNHNIRLPIVPSYATNNAHMFYLVFDSLEKRTKFIKYLQKHHIHTVFHYISLHKSDYYKNKHGDRKLPQTEKYSNCLVRLPLYFELNEKKLNYISNSLLEFYEK